MSQLNEVPIDSQPKNQSTQVVVPSSPARAAGVPPTSFLEKFIDSFFHENNIRWMLVIGASIVFASSLMLVTHEWKSWPVALRFLTIVAYTTATYVFAEIAKLRLGLKTTASVLQALTLLLLPIPFLSLAWLGPATWMGVAESALHATVLLLPTAALTLFLSKRIFENLLHGQQRTFHISYCLLCVAGAMPALHRVDFVGEFSLPWLAATISTGLWFVMTLGVVKVNRHIFWLTEEHRLPRIFGFFPIALLGGQFLILLASKTIWSIHIEWLGFGCVMLATTILATGRSVALVFKQRTGDLVRPLPWPIVLPIFVGLATLALGVGVSFFGFSFTGPTTYAVVPTALVAAMVLLWAANETRHPGFVWCGMLLVAVAYQCAPTLVADWVVTVKSTAAAALNEPRLPVAFYGITYLPLLSVFAIASRRLYGRKRFEFSQPMQTFVTGMSITLLGLSLTHLKASLPVALISAVTFAGMAVLFRDRRYMIGSILAWLIVSLTFVPVVNAMHWAVLPERHIMLALSLFAALTTLASPLDGWLLRIPLPSDCAHLGLIDRDGKPREMLALSSGFLTHVLSLLWMVVSLAYIVIRDPQCNVNFAGGIILASLTVQIARTKLYVLGLNLWSLAAIAFVIEVIELGGSAMTVVSALSIMFAAVSVLSWFVLVRLQLPLSPLAQYVRSPQRECISGRLNSSSMPTIGAFLGPLGDVSLFATLCLATFIHLPLILATNGFLRPLAAPTSTSAIVMACVVLANILRLGRLAIFMVIVCPLWLSAMVVTFAGSEVSYPLLTLIWSISLSGILALGQRLIGSGQFAADEDLQKWRQLGFTISHTSAAGLLFLLFGCIFYLDHYTLSAALIAAAMLWYVNRKRIVIESAGLAVLAHGLSFYVVEIVLGNRGWVWGIELAQWLRSVPFLIPFVVLGVALFDHPWPKFSQLIVQSWGAVLRVLFVVGCVLSLLPHTWGTQDIPFFVIAIVGMAAVELRIAVRRQVVGYLWTSVTCIALAVLLLAAHRVLHFGVGTGQLVLLCIAMVAMTLSRTLAGLKYWGFAATTCQQIGLVIPGCAAVSSTALCIRGMFGSAEIPLGSALNTMTMLGAAGIYFFHGTATRQRRFVLMALTIFNIALALTWSTLQWYDLQLYLVPLGVSVILLVELLRKELPPSAHDPLRYIGALTILVSPMLEILRGSWWHLLSLLLLCVCIVLASIGLRLRALMYTGSAFLLVDLAAMVIHSSFDHPQFLWIAGVAIGGGVIGLAAICENQRERLLDRIRMISAELATWH